MFNAFFLNVQRHEMSMFTSLSRSFFGTIGLRLLNCNRREVQVGKDQEKAQSEKDSLKNRVLGERDLELHASTNSQMLFLKLKYTPKTCLFCK